MVSYKIVLKALFLSLVTVMLMILTISCSTNDSNTISKEERMAQSIDSSLMCPVCPSETINESQVPIAKQMRGLVREKLAEGLTKEQVLEYFADRYGNGILAKPPMSGFNLIVWVIPPVIVIGSIVLMVVIINNMKKPDPVVYEGLSEIGNDLDAYLEIVDRNIDVLKGNVMPDKDSN